MKEYVCSICGEIIEKEDIATIKGRTEELLWKGSPIPYTRSITITCKSCYEKRKEYEAGIHETCYEEERKKLDEKR